MYKKVEVGYDKLRGNNPFTTAFCRTMSHGNILVVGGIEECKKYIRTLGPSLVSYRYWRNGESRGSTTIENVDRCFMFSDLKAKNNCNHPKKILYFQGKEIARYRRIPSTFPTALREML